MTRRLAAALAVALGLGALQAGALASIAPAPPAFAADACEPGSVVYAPQTPAALALLGAEAAWQRASGAGVLVAVVDSGVDAGNPHLADAVVGGIDLVGDGERPDGLSDPHGHGTAVAGQIAARPVAGSGVVGLAPDARLLSVRVFRGEDEQAVRDGFGPSSERLAAGIRYAAENGADIINVSLSDGHDAGEVRDAVDYATSLGSLVVASAGNRATAGGAPDGPRYPAGYPNALGVAAADAAGLVTDDSIHGPQVDVSAPGLEVLTAATGGGDCLFAADAPSSSFATAYASAAAALVAEAHREEGPEGWAYRLAATALRSDPDRRDDVSGWGLVQPAAAIELLPDASTRGPAGPFFDTSTSAVRPARVTVTPDHSPSPFVLTRETTILIAIAGATVLAVLGIALVLRRRAADAAEEPVPLPRGGLLDRPDPEEPGPQR